MHLARNISCLFFLCLFSIAWNPQYLKANDQNLQDLKMNGKSIQYYKEDEKFTIGNWNIALRSKKYKECNIKSIPIQEVTNIAERDLTYVKIFYLGKDKYTIVVKAGYALNKNKGLAIEIEGKKYYLNFTKHKKYAKSYSSGQDIKIINALIKSTSEYFVVHGVSQDDETSTDYYAFAGFIESLLYLQQKCGN